MALLDRERAAMIGPVDRWQILCETLFPRDGVDRASRLVASFVGAMTGSTFDALGVEIDEVMVELGYQRVGESEWSTPDSALTFERTRALLSSLAAIAQFAAARASHLERARSLTRGLTIAADDDDEDVIPGEDFEASRDRELEVLRLATELLHEIRRTHFFKRPDPGEDEE